jgi:hypothetical protein
MKIGRNFEKEWEQYLRGSDLVHEANTVISTSDGGALIAGHTYLPDRPGRSIDAPFATRIDGAGNVLWTREYGTRQWMTGMGRLACGVQIDGGVLLVGMKSKLWADQPTNTGTALGKELWVIKLNDKGGVLWETSIAVDGDELVAPLQLRQAECSIHRPDDQGNVAFAISFQAGSSIVRDGKRIVVGPEIKHEERHRILVFKFDAEGKELARARLRDATRPRLFKTANGYVVIDSSLLRSQRGVRQTTLDRDLKVLSQRIVGDSRSYFSMETALADGEGGFHLAGYRVFPPAARGRVAIAYLNENGEIVAEKTFGLWLPSWEPVALVTGDSPAELVLLQRGEDGYDIRLMKLRYSK